MAEPSVFQLQREIAELRTELEAAIKAIECRRTQEEIREAIWETRIELRELHSPMPWYLALWDRLFPGEDFPEDPNG